MSCSVFLDPDGISLRIYTISLSIYIIKHIMCI